MSALLEKLDYEFVTRIKVSRGDIYLADLGMAIGSEQSGVRPVVIIQNELGNQFAPTVLVAPVSSSQSKKPLPTHVTLKANKTGLLKDSVAYLEQIKTIDKCRLYPTKLTKLDEQTMREIDAAIKISFFGVGEMYK